MKSVSGFMMTLLVSSAAFSAAATQEGIKITSYTVNKKQVLVQYGSDEILRIGTVLTAGEGCKLKVVRIKGQKAITTSDDCEAKRLIKKGKLVKIYDYQLEEAKPVVQITQPLPVVAAPSTHVLKGVEVSTFFYGANQLEINGQNISGQIDTGFSYGASARYVDIKNNNLGIIAGASYGFGQQITAIEYKSKDGSVDKPKQALDKTEVGAFSYALPEVNIALGFAERAYVYGGPNYSVPFSQALPGVRFNGDVGFQVGAGVRVVENLTVEVSFRSLNYQLELRDEDKQFLNDNLDVETANQKGVLGRLAYTF